MFYIASTRFNNDTYNENFKYRNKSGIPLIYGTSIRIQAKYDIGSLMFVVEMNNEENRIEGIGLIRNTLVYDKQHNIYSNSDYNRYLYRGDYWVDRATIVDKDAEIVEICDTVLFKGKSHLKRMSCISVLTKKLFANWDYKLCILKEKIRILFINVFGNSGGQNIIYENNLKELSLNLNLTLDNGEGEGEEKDTFEIIPVKRRKIMKI